jgi:glycosyltransferase involved in cell wall biosynthesis
LFAMFHRAKYDKIVALNYSPITAVFPAIVYKKFHKVKLILWVQDLWPESVRATSNVKSGFVDRILLSMAKFIYRNSDKILLSNDGFVEPVLAKGAKKEKISFMPNWAEDLFEDKSYIHLEKFKSLIPTGFIVMFAGNIGEAQDFDSIIEAAALTSTDKRIKWVIIGDGRKKEWLSNVIVSKGLGSTVFVLGSFPLEDMPSFFIHSDLMLATLKNEHIFSLTVPGKIQSYMAFGKPIVTMLSGAGSNVVSKSECGFVADASDYKKLAENVMFASGLPEYRLIEMGNNGKKYYKDHFAKDLALDKLLFAMNDL